MKKSIIFLFVVLFSSTVIAQQQKKATPAIKYGDNPKAGKYFSTGGIKLYYETYGQGKPLLLIHGNGGSIRDYRYQIPYFS